MLHPDSIATLMEMWDMYFGTSGRASSTMLWLPAEVDHLWNEVFMKYYGWGIVNWLLSS